MAGKKPTWQQLYEMMAQRLDKSRQENFDLRRQYYDEMKAHIAALQRSSDLSMTVLDLMRMTQHLVRTINTLNEHGRSKDLDEFLAEGEAFLRNITLH